MLIIMHLMKQVFIAIRPKQWMKNALVLSAPLAAGTFFQLEVFQKSLGAFFIFSGAAACIYLVNDSFDRKMDAQHPIKSFRPIASGSLPVGLGLAVSIALGSLSTVFAYFYGLAAGLIISTYLSMNILYSLYVKRIAVLELLFIASGFGLRAALGGAATDTELTVVFLFVISCFSIFLAGCKRHSELISHEISSQRHVLARYSSVFLRNVMILSSCGGILGYLAWFVQSSNINLFLVLISFISLLLGCFRFFRLALAGNAEDPTTQILLDPYLRSLAIIWVSSFLGSVYA
tara:strand:- start:4384 stop:5253 length:870 start_codon:yes stop_codon:yes gene_type:complete